MSVRVWTFPGRVMCTITDQGCGFDDPFAGYLHGGGQALPEGRFGLCLARERSDELVTARTCDGFTVLLTTR